MLIRRKEVTISCRGNVLDVVGRHRVDGDALDIVYTKMNRTLDDYLKNFSNGDDEDRYYLSVCKEAISFLLILLYVRWTMNSNVLLTTIRTVFECDDDVFD